MRRALLVLLLAAGWTLPFLGKPIHVDEANLLALAGAAAADPWAPHGALHINWEGRTEPALAVLANPPGLAWWLAPWHDAPVRLARLSMLPWCLLAGWGARTLGRALGDDRLLPLLAVSPLVVLHLPALLPDLPVLALTLAGLGGFLRGRRPGLWAAVAGASVLFRYSGLVTLGALAAASRLHRRPRAALWGLLPLVILAGHDLAAYGRLHLLDMVGFQARDLAPLPALHRLAAGLGMLGSAATFPLLLAWNRRSPLPAAAGALAGLALSAAWDHTPLQAATTVLALAAGGVLLSAHRAGRREDRFLAAWTLLGLAFLLPLRFVAGRYLLAFLPAPLLAALRLRPGLPRLALAATASGLLALGMAADDAAFARAQARMAADVAPLGPAVLAGHWGWQHHLEARGWRPLEQGEPPPPLLAVSEVAWPQTPGPGCTEELARLVAAPPWPFPRVHTARGAANVHASLVMARPRPVPVVSAVGWGDDPYDTVRVLVPCAERSRGSAAPMEPGVGP